MIADDETMNDEASENRKYGSSPLPVTRHKVAAPTRKEVAIGAIVAGR